MRRLQRCSHSNVSAELCASKQFYFDLYCIGMSDVSVSGSVLLYEEKESPVPFFVYNACMSNATASPGGFAEIHPHCVGLYRNRSPTIRAFKKDVQFRRYSF